jgi:hypothetical protein
MLYGVLLRFAVDREPSLVEEARETAPDVKVTPFKLPLWPVFPTRQRAFEGAGSRIVRSYARRIVKSAAIRAHDTRASGR